MRFKAGRYYVGDPCYAIADEFWCDYCDELFNAQAHGETGFDFHGHPVWQSNTCWGDGEYNDSDGRSYAVDAGLIGIVPMELIDKLGPSGNDKGVFPMKIDGGHIVDFPHDFECHAEDNGSLIFIGDITINTRDHPAEDDEEDWY